ncbi:MAG: sulfur carrier protein ThiS, partial [Muribaculaceae bacterium]|nr:sulfur carrier protein ThiS [Muribaculaceae bacterium]
LLTREGFTGVGQAVAVNNCVVPRGDWNSFAIADGMKLTVIRAVCGG